METREEKGKDQVIQQFCITIKVVHFKSQLVDIKIICAVLVQDKNTDV